ncbi:adenylate kinase [Dysgonomonas macrotermitis]|uniref:Adenylate kinase n=1 Tax=Dysgonomonas macrotermitis TaxID=1346286 RepID=A0A1M5FBB8_9BACT|nr:adenylate kinase [Dysgonomonas macrotermitis]SHF88739.1 adenylate kinase [Dysgonomonas macrotermitis]
MLNIVIFGAPGSGKGTQSENLIKKYNLAHISTGDVLRAEKASGTELGKLADSYMSKGQLIPDELMIDILASVFDQKIKAGDCKGVIFDGFPRTIPQGKALSEMLEKRNQSISAVVSLDVPEEELIERLINRGKQTGRNDDNYETIKARLDVYYNQTTPLKELFEKEGKLYSIEGVGTVDEIFGRISSVIDSVK